MYHKTKYDKYQPFIYKGLIQKISNKNLPILNL